MVLRSRCWYLVVAGTRYLKTKLLPGMMCNVALVAEHGFLIQVSYRPQILSLVFLFTVGGVLR